MIRLSLPPYDPKQPLAFRAACSVQGWDWDDMQFSPFQVRMHPDTFVGDVLIPFDDVNLGQRRPDERVPFYCEVTLSNPEAFGLTGAEGWFDLAPWMDRWVFIHDLVVYYTPREQQDDGRSEGFFS